MADPIQSDLSFTENWSEEKYTKFIEWVNANHWDKIVDAYEEMVSYYEEEQKPVVDRWTYQKKEYLLDDVKGVVYDYDKFENYNEVVVIGYRVPNTNEGKLYVLHKHH